MRTKIKFLFTVPIFLFWVHYLFYLFFVTHFNPLSAHCNQRRVRFFSCSFLMSILFHCVLQLLHILGWTIWPGNDENENSQKILSTEYSLSLRPPAFTYFGVNNLTRKWWKWKQTENLKVIIFFQIMSFPPPL